MPSKVSRSIAFLVTGSPKPKQSFRKSSTGRGGFSDPAVVSWQNRVAWAAKEAMQGEDLMTGPFFFARLLFVRSDNLACDVDNLSKAVLDAMRHVVYEDDKRVALLEVAKVVRPGWAGGVVVVVEEIPEDWVALDDQFCYLLSHMRKANSSDASNITLPAPFAWDDRI